MKSKISIILFLITTTFIYSQSDVKVLSSDFNSITIEYSPVYVDTTIKVIEGKTYRNIELFLGTLKNSENWGFPSVIERKLNVGVPTEFGNTIEILSTIYKEISGQLIPVPYPVEDSLSVSFEYKQNAEYFSFVSDENLVTFGEFWIDKGCWNSNDKHKSN